MEIWKDIKNYQGLYQVSNLGRIVNKNTKQLLKPYIMQTECKLKTYCIYRIRLSKNNKSKAFLIHRLVWAAFNGDIPEGYQIDHINNNPADNRLENLQCITASENNKKRFTDNKKLGEFINKSKRKKIKCLNNNITYNSISDAAKQLSLYHQNISKVLKGKYKSTEGYKFCYLGDENEVKK